MTNKQIAEKHEKCEIEKRCLECEHEDIPATSEPCWDCIDKSNWRRKDPIDPIVRCKDCKHRPRKREPYQNGLDIDFPDDVCPLHVPDPWYSQMPDDDWFCANGEKENVS